MRHFDAHAYRTEDAEGVWDFARGCIRTYLILRDKVRRFHEDPDIADALRVARRQDIHIPTSPDGLGAGAIARVRAEAAPLDVEALAATGYGHERLDQLVTELLLGVR
jgi:xylose isomerase